MMDDIDELIASAEANLAALTQTLARLRAIGARQAVIADDLPDLGIKDLIPAADGAALARIAKSTMNTWCRKQKHAIRGDAGFALRIGKRWSVSRSRLLRHLASGSSD